jgi:glycosyltransferase involved in cell wall biosynthesis
MNQILKITHVYILAKNESANIEKCINSLLFLIRPPIILDSGSTDSTEEIARRCGAQVRSYDYRNHCDTYNDLTTQHQPQEYVVILDADMRISLDGLLEALSAMQYGLFDVAKSSVEMWWEGGVLRRSSLYPPKPFLFRGGKSYFVPVGHGEALKPDISVYNTKRKIIHDDRKGFSAYMSAQARYSKSFATRLESGQLNWRDRLRARTPFMILLAPLWCYVIRCGFLDGRRGLLYALDRIIAETAFYRSAVHARIEHEETKIGSN